MRIRSKLALLAGGLLMAGMVLTATSHPTGVDAEGTELGVSLYAVPESYGDGHDIYMRVSNDSATTFNAVYYSCDMHRNGRVERQKEDYSLRSLPAGKSMFMPEYLVSSYSFDWDRRDEWEFICRARGYNLLQDTDHQVIVPTLYER